MSRNVIIAVVLVAVLVVVAYFFLLFKPRQDEIAELRSEIEGVQAQQVQVQQRITRLREVRSRAPEIEAKIVAAEAVVPRDPALPSALRQLQLAADEAGLELSSISPGRPGAVGGEAPAGLAQLSLSVTITGGYFQIVDFLRRLEDPGITPRGIVWSSISVSPSEYPTLTASISGRMFALLEQPVPPAPDDDDEDDETENAA